MSPKVFATVGPPVEIKMAGEFQRAVSGEKYEGVLAVQMFESGTLGDFALAGDGWRDISVEWPEEWKEYEVGMLEIPFSAIPTDADSPLSVSMTINGRKVQQVFELGPRYFEQRGKPQLGRRLEGKTVADVLGIDVSDSTQGPSASGDAIPLRFVGRIFYDRAGVDIDDDGEIDFEPVTLGVDRIRVRVEDVDPVGSETIWSGLTDVNGFFDSEIVMWDDCDVTGCDDPDLMLYYELDTSVVDVTDNSLTEDTYEWHSPEIKDFGGSMYDFGWWTAPSSAEMPALHIFNQIVRVHRFINDYAGYNTPKVQVEWPEDSDGNAGAFYQDGSEEIHVRPAGQWRDTTLAHEYGHHFINMFANNTSPDYCNGYCDGSEQCTSGGDDCPDPGHCGWCPENPTDAFNEGWPNWLADVFTRTFIMDYTDDDGMPLSPLGFRSLESIDTCCQDNNFGDAFDTENFIGALLRDIEDSRQDTDLGGWDSLCLGVDEIFDVLVNFDPTTPQLFLLGFATMYPEHTALLYPTARNISIDFVQSYPEDNTPPGNVVNLNSSTHPLGVGSGLPCIFFEWDHAPDEGRGACNYSYEWTENPNGVMPDSKWEDRFHSGCQMQDAGFFDLGQYYLSIRTWDCGGNASNGFATFGPFEVTDCNNTGILDLCDISCAHPGYENCNLNFFCNGQAGCGNSSDCQPNLKPDECDLADGTSEDCNLSGVPDECETIFHWDEDGTVWDMSSSWEEDSLPTNGSDVCIDVPGDTTATVTNATAVIGTLACSENFRIQNSVLPRPDITLNDPSWIRGDFTLAGGLSDLRVEDRLDIDGAFNWTGSNNSITPRLSGAGTTYAHGGMNQSSITTILGHHLVLEGASTSQGWFACSPGSSTIELMPGATWDHQGTSTVMNGCTDDEFINHGTFIKSAGGASRFSAHVVNNGRLDVRAGTLGLWNGSIHSGEVVGNDGGVFELVGGQHMFLADSSIDVETFVLNNGGGSENVIHGDVNVRSTLIKDAGQTLTFADDANVTSYGDVVQILRGNLHFNAVIGGDIVFSDLTIGESPFSGGTSHFNSGDSVVTGNLTMTSGNFRGTSNLTITEMMSWNAASTFRDPGVINVEGDSVIGRGGGQKNLIDRTMNNHGTMVFNGGFMMSGPAVLNNLSDGVLDFRVDSGGAVIGGGSTTIVNNAGTLIKTAGPGNSDIRSPFFNTGLVEPQVGGIRFLQQFTQTAGESRLNGGNMVFWWSNVNIPPMLLEGGRVVGTGSILATPLIDVINTGATVSPGLSAGSIYMQGHYLQSDDGSYEVEIGGTDETEYDRLEVEGTATLGGELRVASINGFTPADGNKFVILTANSIVGEFDSIVMPPQYSIDYDATEVRLYVPLFGDVDGSGQLDLLDYGAFQTCFAGPGQPPAAGCVKDAVGDLDGDTDVDLDDYSVLFSLTVGP